MQYVRSLGGSVSKTWNSINPATLSGAIDVVVVEQDDGTLACSPFHVRFGKFSLLRPSDKKVEFRVNGEKQDYSMKLGDGGEAFFVFETTADIPVDLQTSPVLSPTGSPQSLSQNDLVGEATLQEPDLLDLSAGRLRKPSGSGRPRPQSAIFGPTDIPLPSQTVHAQDDLGTITPLSGSPPTEDAQLLANWSPSKLGIETVDASYASEELGQYRRNYLHNAKGSMSTETLPRTSLRTPEAGAELRFRSQSPPPVTKQEAINRAITLSKKLSTSNIRSKINETGDLMLDMEGYKSAEADALRAEKIARQFLAEELQGNYDIGALIGADERGNLWIYSSEEAKEAAVRRGRLSTVSEVLLDDAASDPGHQSDDDQTLADIQASEMQPFSNQSVSQMATPPQTPEQDFPSDTKSYAKTLRLTSDQLKALNLKSGRNPISFTVNRATCQASMHYWSHDVPVVISDIDGTITKSDALGHVLNMFGRDWTHPGVAKLFTDITANGYNIMYLTSRSVGQADTTRAYLAGINQEGIKLPLGPVILSPDRTIAALRREVYLRKPEVFKMSCLRDIASLFGQQKNPFYAGFGNRLTDALSYRSVNIPPNRIFTINPEGSVSIDILALNTYKSSYVSMRELVPHFFPPVGTLVKSGGENFTDFSYWRSSLLDIEEFTDSEDDDDSYHSKHNESEDEGFADEDDPEDNDDGDGDEDEDEDDAENMTESYTENMTASYMSKESFDAEAEDLRDSILESIEGTDLPDMDSLEQALDAEAPLKRRTTDGSPPKRRERSRGRSAGV